MGLPGHHIGGDEQVLLSEVNRSTVIPDPRIMLPFCQNVFNKADRFALPYIN